MKFSLTEIREAARRANARKAADANLSPINLDFAKLDEALERGQWEVNARATLIRMFCETQAASPQTDGLDVPFTFNVAPGNAGLYVNAMRAVLARVRKKAMANRQTLQPFKLIVMRLEPLPTHDVITVVRTQSTSLGAKSVYDGLIAQMVTENEAK